MLIRPTACCGPYFYNDKRKGGYSVSALNKTKFVVDKIFEVISTVILAIMTVLVVYQVITRYVFNAPSAISEILSQYLFVWMIMFGSAYVYGSREHLTIDLLKDKFPPKMNMVVEIITNICLFAFIVLICVYGGYLYTIKSAPQVDAQLGVSKALLYSSLPITGVVTLFYAVYNCVLAVFNYKNHKRTYGDELSGTA